MRHRIEHIIHTEPVRFQGETLPDTVDRPQIPRRPDIHIEADGDHDSTLIVGNTSPVRHDAPVHTQGRVRH